MLILDRKSGKASLIQGDLRNHWEMDSKYRPQFVQGPGRKELSQCGHGEEGGV